ncbi:MAG: biopolymer transporter ExbD [Chitinophagales bacterium]|nr:biopolymer transporter ExbD [Chitinophagales bacterium]
MAKVKPHRSAPSIDMTPMVDLAFLLVTFFMLTAKFRPDEPVQIVTPASHSQFKLPESGVLVLTIANDGRVFYDMDGKDARYRVITAMAEKYNVQLSEQEKTVFVLSPSVAVPMSQMKSFLAQGVKAQKGIKQPGIPSDTANNELKDWIIQSRIANPTLRVAIKGDNEAKYPKVNSVMKTLQDLNVTIFNLITNAEADAEKPVAKEN